MIDRESKNRLRAMVRGAYDLQKMRIQAGNRVLANFKAKLGLRSGEKETDLDSDEAKALLKDIRQRYDRMMDGYKSFPKSGSFVGDELISSFTELCLVDQYFVLRKEEIKHFDRLEGILEEFEIWTRFLKNVRGVGPAMGAVLIAELDPYDWYQDANGHVCSPDTPGVRLRKRNVSSFWRYAGLDVVSKWVLQKTVVCKANPTRADPTPTIVLEAEALEYEDENGEFVCRSDFGQGAAVVSRYFDDAAPQRIPDADYQPTDQCAVVQIDRDGFEILATYRMFHCGGRSRRDIHLVDVKYKARDGEWKTKRSITFNPFLKTKLLGVLGPVFLRCGSEWRDVYDNVKQRYQNRPDCADWSKGRVHRAAVRYMLKTFLSRLYLEWRKIEGLEARAPYAEAKLGIKHNDP